MVKKKFYLILDTETTMEGTVADFGAVVCDRHGEIHAQVGVLVAKHYGTFELFHQRDSTLWNLERRKAQYASMLESGSRMVASVNAVNTWLQRAQARYNPELTAYNLSFDKDKCQKTGIDINIFSNEFCLWQAAIGNICESKNYRKFVLENHGFNPPTDLRNMSLQTNAELVAGFVSGNLQYEPHTALEDARDFELPILRYILKRKKWREKIKPYSWRDFQVKNHFIPR